jgi:hypothetical protein
LDDAFIPKDLFEKYELDKHHGQQYSGKAIINFDKSKSKWGWKIIELNPL